MVDEVIVVRLERAVASHPAFAAHMRGLVAQAGRSGSVKQISGYLDRGQHPVSLVERSDRGEGSRRTSPDRHALS